MDMKREVIARELYEIWKELIDDIKLNEEEVRGELNLSDSFSVYEILKKMGKYWIEEESSMIKNNNFNRKKWVRTATVKIILDDLGIEYNNEILKLSIVLDAIVNSADDLSDLKLDESNKKKQIEYLVREVLSWVLYSKLLTEFSLNHHNKINKLLMEMKKYFVELSYIPLIERKYYEEIRNLSNESEIIDKACDAYISRAVDIKIFSKLFLLTNDDLPEEKKKRIEELLRYTRALEILAKDWYDLDYDLKEQDVYTPLIALQNLFGDESIEKYVKEIYERINEKIKEKFSSDKDIIKIVEVYSSKLFNYFG